MADYKFKVYEKINGDDSIPFRLLDQHEKAPDEVSEAQLKKNHVGEQEVITEKLLDKNRSDDDHKTIEKRLNDAKAKHRNKAAYKGDINKLEEQRISKKEKVKEYELASETPKSLKWWNVKSQDGLKIASNTTQEKKVASKITTSGPSSDLEKEKLYRIAQNLFRYANTDEDDEVDPVFFSPENENENDPKDFVDRMKIIKDEKIQDSYNPELYMVLAYDSNDQALQDFDGEFLKSIAFQKVINEKPFLTNVLTTSDFSVNLSQNKVILDVYGHEYFENQPNQNVNQEIPNFMDKDWGKEEQFKIQDIQEKDVNGTPMVTGKVSVPAGSNLSLDEIADNVVNLVNKTHPGLLTVDSLDLSRVSEGEVSFLVSKDVSDVNTTVASSILDFPIIIASSKKK